MGDMEDAEVRALRRDAELDWYNDWLRDFAENGEARVTLVSWLQFDWYCVPCGTTARIIKRGEHSYEGNCLHVFDREGVDLDRAENAQHEAYEAAMELSSLRDCPIHLVRVPMIDWYRNYGTNREIEVLACGCNIVQPPERRPCPDCPRLIDGEMRAPRVVKRLVVEKHRDPTMAYELECGHTTIDM